jgi:transposase
MPINFRISDLAPVGLIVESITQLDDAILVAARAGIQVATCPLCGSPSRRVHSRYVREVLDLPWERHRRAFLKCALPEFLL